MKAAKELSGQRFGRLIAMIRSGTHKSKGAIWLCRCDCGNNTNIRACNLISGVTSSCGCYNKDRVLEANTKHGNASKKRTSEYTTWIGIKDRCLNVNSSSYKNYGARGIQICDRWKCSFENFFEDMGPKPSPELTIDRINNDGNYEPSNCRWATWDQQASNRRVKHAI